MSRLSLLATFGLLAAQGTASILGRRRFDSSVPFYDYDPNVPTDCNLWWNSDDGISCETVLLITGLSIVQLTSMVSVESRPSRLTLRQITQFSHVS